MIRAEHPWEGLRARAVECVSEISWKVSHMDPEQLARAADQADEALAAQTNDYALQAAIAERRPDLWAALASNPSSYPDLLVWLSKLSDPAVRAELEARGAVLQGTTVARADAESQDPEASREEDDSHGGGTT